MQVAEHVKDHGTAKAFTEFSRTAMHQSGDFFFGDFFSHNKLYKAASYLSTLFSRNRFGQRMSPAPPALSCLAVQFLASGMLAAFLASLAACFA
jgi:hypothetical protein